jgi:hypothetical protein
VCARIGGATASVALKKHIQMENFRQCTGLFANINGNLNLVKANFKIKDSFKPLIGKTEHCG